MATTGLKMAKASAADMNMAFGVAGILDSIGRGYYPVLNDETEEQAEKKPSFFNADDKEHLRYLYDLLCKLEAKGSLFRVVGGFQVIMDNDVMDPAESHIDWHPTLKAAVDARTAARDSKMFLIYAKKYAKDGAIWWRPDGKGYTTDLQQAGRYTEADAMASANGSHGDHIAIAETDVMKLSTLHVIDAAEVNKHLRDKGGVQ